MSTVMEFWGVEVKSGQLHKVNPGDSKIVHLSQASLGEIKKDKGSENVRLYLKVNDKKLVIGSLSPEKLPQLSFDLVLEKDFELSHNWKNGSVYFTGYKVRMEQGTISEDDELDEDEDAMEITHSNNGQDKAHLGKPELQAKSVSEKANAIKPDASTAKQNLKVVKPNQKADDSDSDDSNSKALSTDDDETSDDEVPNRTNNQSDESSDELDESDEDEEESNDESESDDEDETPKKAEPSKKRPAESGSKTPVPDKKTKFITPQKTEGKKGIVHTATPHPSKRPGKTPANTSQTKQTQKSGGSYPCKSCNRSFTTEGGLQAHTKAKHSAAE